MLWGECISGALYQGDLFRIAQKIGFDDPRILSSAPIEVTDPELKDIVGEAKFSSITYRFVSHIQLLLAITSPTEDYHPLWRMQCVQIHSLLEASVLPRREQATTGTEPHVCRLFKLPGLLETPCEDYGQVAVYKGTIPGHKHAYELDDHHRFITNKPMLVCGSTAAMVGDSWLGKHFQVTGDRSVHYGLFDCGDSAGAVPCGPDAPAVSGGGCC